MGVSELYHSETRTETYIDENNDHHPLKIGLYHLVIVVPILKNNQPNNQRNEKWKKEKWTCLF